MITTTNRSCSACVRGKLRPFSALTDAEQKRLLQQKHVHVYERGEIVYHEDTPGLAVYCIQSGRLEQYHEAREGTGQGARMVCPGQLSGLVEILLGLPYASSAKVLETAELCIIPGALIQKLVTESHAFSQSLLRVVAEDLFRLVQHVAEMAWRPVKQRLARTLIDSVQPASGEISRRRKLRISLMRSDLAELAGTTPESCSRALGALQDARMVELTRHDIVIRNLNALKRFAALERHEASG
jgi:CRP-like cAMP-binding protein